MGTDQLPGVQRYYTAGDELAGGHVWPQAASDYLHNNLFAGIGAVRRRAYTRHLDNRSRDPRGWRGRAATDSAGRAAGELPTRKTRPGHGGVRDGNNRCPDYWAHAWW